MSKLVTLSLTIAAILIFIVALSGCPGKLAPSVVPTSTISNSEIAEAVASGAITSTDSNLSEARFIPQRPRTPKEEFLAQVRSYFTLLPKAEAALTQGVCPTLQTGSIQTGYAPNSSCGSGTNIVQQQFSTLTWTPCNGTNPSGTWSGTVNMILLTTNAVTPTQMQCAVAPQTFQANDVVWRSFLSPSARINNAILDSANLPYNPLTGIELNPPNNPSSPVTVLVDTYGANLVPPGYIPGGSIPFPQAFPTGYSGYAYPVPTLGEVITYTGAIARSINVYGIHLKADINGYIMWDFTVSTSYSGDPTGTPIQVDNTNTIQSGKLYVQDNINGITTLTTFNTAPGGAMGYTGNCGVPTSGSQTTAAFSGNFTTETLTFSPTCAHATLNGSPLFLFHAF